MKKLLGTKRRGLLNQPAATMVRWAGWALLLVALALRIYALGREELQFDEVASFFIANRGPVDLLTYVRGAIREHPPLYYLLLSLWMPLAGRSEFAIRFLSVIIGIVTVATAYKALERMTSRSLALLGTLLLVISPFHVQISRDARMYGLLTLWVLVSIYAFVRLLERGERRDHSSGPRFPGGFFSGLRRSVKVDRDALAMWVLFWVVTGLGMFTHYFMAFILLAQDLYLLLKWRRYRRLLAPWLAIHAVLGGLVTLWAVLSPGPWATLVSLWGRGTASTVRWQALARGLNGLYLGATVRPNWFHLGLCLVVTALGLLPFKRRRASLPHGPGRDALLRGLLLGVPITAVLVLPERVSGRYLTPAFPGSILAMAAGLQGLFAFSKGRLLTMVGGRLRALAAWLLPLALLSGIIFVDVRAYPDVYVPSGESFRARVDYLRHHARPDDGLLLHGPWQHLLLSYHDAGPLRTYTLPLRDLKVHPSQVDPALDQMFENHRRLWVSYDAVEPVDPDWIVAQRLHKGAYQVLYHRGLALYYRSPAEDLPTELQAQPTEDDGLAGRAQNSAAVQASSVQDGNGYDYVAQPDIAFGGQLQLRGVALSNAELESGEAVLLLSQWRVLRDIAPGLAMRLELIGPGNQAWASYHFAVGPARLGSGARNAGDTLTERRGLIVPTGTPPGEYQLRLRVISPEGEDWLPEGEAPFDIGAVRVEHHAPRSQEILALPGRELYAAFEGKMSLIGYAPWGHNFTQGNPLLFDIYWQALDSLDEDYELEIEVIRDRGSVLTRKRVQPVADWSPTSSWKPRDVLKGHYALPLPADARPGPYQVRLSVVTPDGSPLSIEGTRTRRVLDCWEREQTLSGTHLMLFGGNIESRPRQYRPPAMDHQLDVVLSNSEGQGNLRLLGYDLAPIPVEPGGTLELTLYWKTLSRMDRVYAVFNHLVAPDGTALAQQDGWPRQSTYHTTQWMPGEVVEDHYTIEVPRDAPPGSHPLRVGMYDAATKERLLVVVDGRPVSERYVELTMVTVAR